MAVTVAGKGMGTNQAGSVRAVDVIGPLTHNEAQALATAEAERVLAVLESLEGDDWQQPTYCTAWTVRDMVAHLAGACAGYASWTEFRRQYLQNPYLNETGAQVDGINKRQILDRAERTTAELVDEFRAVAPRAIRTRHRLPWLLRAVTIPFGPPLGTAKVAYLTDTIYTRDQWMHRYDLCAATGKSMVISEEHDGRILALVVLDLARKVRRLLGTQAVDLVLRGAGDPVYRLGGSGAPGCTITMSIFDFALLSSDRITVDEASSRVTISGDAHVAHRVLENFSVPY